VDTVDNGDKYPYKEIVWCDHLNISRFWLVETPNIVIPPSIHSIILVVEQGKIKLICAKCSERSMFRGKC